MEDQYFIPKLDELYIGYECEFTGNPYNKMDKSSEWKTIKIGITQQGVEVLPITRLPRMIKMGWIRTPHLSLESLKKEKWIYEDLLRGSGHILRKGNYTLQTLPQMAIGEGRYWSKIYLKPLNSWGKGEIIFDGVIKSINELRKIEQYLKIE